jgi:hypothetical protein
MTALREAAQQVLEAMKKITAHPKNFWDLEEEIAALSTALAEQQQKPVAWQWLNTAHFRKNLPANAESGAWNPLYTAPPRREWQRLTNEEIYPLYNEPRSDAEMLEFARAVEQALKEKNT